jgi:sulfur-carrier protein adenylyltransferase/sulfurtransferase
LGIIGLVDGANVEERNLQTHPLFSQTDIGASKSKVAALKLKSLNPNTQFKIAQSYASKENVLNLVDAFDLVVDCTDNFPTHYLLNDACCMQQKTIVFASMHQFTGRVAVFNHNGGPSLRCLVPKDAKDELNTSEAGVFSTLPSLIGSIQANEVLKLILKNNDVLKGHLLQINMLDYALSIKHIAVTEAVKITELGEYDLKMTGSNKALPSSISVEVLRSMLNQNSKLKIIDVREYYEWDICHIKGAVNIPMNLIDECIDEISREATTVLVCHHGVRSLNVLHYLETKGYTNLINLEGGIHAWASRVEKDMPTY